MDAALVVIFFRLYNSTYVQILISLLPEALKGSIESLQCFTAVIKQVKVWFVLHLKFIWTIRNRISRRRGRPTETDDWSIIHSDTVKNHRIWLMETFYSPNTFFSFFSFIYSLYCIYMYNTSYYVNASLNKSEMQDAVQRSGACSRDVGLIIAGCCNAYRGNSC